MKSFMRNKQRHIDELNDISKVISEAVDIVGNACGLNGPIVMAALRDTASRIDWVVNCIENDETNVTDYTPKVFQCIDCQQKHDFDKRTHCTLCEERFFCVNCLIDHECAPTENDNG